VKKMLAAAALIPVMFCLAGCGAVSNNEFDIDSVHTYRDIPGVTEEEIAAIEALKSSRESFTYGLLFGTEAFILPDGSSAGFSVKLCALLSKLFGINFNLEFYEWDELISNLESQSVDFTGELTPTKERMQTYGMSLPIAERLLRIFTLTDSGINREKDIDGLALGFLEGTITAGSIYKSYPFSFSRVEIDNYQTAASMLFNREIAAFVEEAVADPAFDEYDFIQSREFFPLVYTSVSLTTANPGLKPVIDVVNRYLAAGGIDVLYGLYKEGNSEYAGYKLDKAFTEEERAYLNYLAAQGAAVKVALENDNYPASFYNKADKEYQGIAVDVLSEISKLTGIRFEAANGENAPWSEILEMLKTGEASLVSQLLYSDERRDGFLWTDKPYASAYYALLSRSDYPNLTSYQVVRAVVGALNKSAYEDKYKEWFPESDNLVLYDDKIELLDALASGEIDLLMGSDYLLIMQQNYREKPGFKINIRFDSPSDSYFGFNKNETVLKSIINKAQVFVDTETIAYGWTNRGYNYEKKLAEQRSLYFMVITAFVSLLLLLTVFFLIKNRKLNLSLDKTVKEQTTEIRTALTKLKAVISNYSGVIWSVNKDGQVTLFDGLYLNEIGVTPDFIEGKKLELARQKNRHLDVIDRVQKTFAEGPQDWIGDIDGRMFHSHTTPIYDDDGNVTGVVGSTDDINKYIQLQKELENALEEAKAANKAKSAFLSTMSHEIRTPMNAILGITEIQLQNDALGQDAREVFDKIYNSGSLLLGIINDILDLSKIEAGKLELAPAKYETASFISDTAQLNIMRIGSKRIEFDIQVDENLPAALLGDELRVKQILNNILSNAFKYTAEGMVKLSVSAEAGGNDQEITLVVRVGDTGQGMTKEQVDKLFDEYSRFNMEANRTTEGTGLGMSITRNLIRLMNGEIFIESEPGKGSTFTVRLPQGRPGPEVLGGETAESLHQFRTSSRAQMKRMPVAREYMPYGSVLIVDDIETNIYVAKGLMAPYGLKIDSAGSGFDAIEKIKSGSVYDIVFMDHMMPKMDGIETTMNIRSMGYGRTIVALTANAVSGQSDIFLGNGFDDFISKPIDVQQLNAILNKFIRDTQPPDVLEAAKREAEAKKEKSSGDAPQAAVETHFAEIFVRDANKSLAALDLIMKKGGLYDENDIRAYVVNVHGMKSALANIGKTDLSAVARKLEQDGRDGNKEAIASETPAFLSSLRDFVNELTPKEETTGQDVTDEDEVYLCKMLLAIKTACEEYDEKTAEGLLTELKGKTWSRQTNELLGAISGHLLHSDFDEIVDGITKFQAASENVLNRVKNG
jgi:signal transduction histidine kinase/ABC-type amino acid transport substrate-binding protein/DNA-binding response OmpR family regulator